FLNYLHLSGNFKIYEPVNVLDVALDEQYQYSGQYLMLENFESKAINDEFNMRKTDSSIATALVEINPAASTEKSLQILPGNYDEFFVLQYKLPAGKTLRQDYTHFEFDIFYDVTGDNQNQDLKVDFDVLQSTPFFKTSTGLRSNHGKWEHITVPLTGVLSENMFKLYIGVRTRSANYYIDNLKLKSASTVVTSNPETDLTYYCSNKTLYLNSMAKKISVYNLSGNLMLTEANKSEINISGLLSGVYVIKANFTGKDYTFKFVNFN
ncbi:MAG TPA: T9SS type A sorting domain-containing protein, partial [Paludibacter sp.]|nr:T9SS type A sorting domain-containing protein [Paludibacter sp.]